MKAMEKKSQLHSGDKCLLDQNLECWRWNIRFYLFLFYLWNTPTKSWKVKKIKTDLNIVKTCNEIWFKLLESVGHIKRDSLVTTIPLWTLEGKSTGSTGEREHKLINKELVSKLFKMYSDYESLMCLSFRYFFFVIFCIVKILKVTITACWDRSISPPVSSCEGSQHGAHTL